MKENLPNEYLEFIESCRMKEYGELFTHKHHILPKFMGGDDTVDNLIEIGVEDHFKAHLILAETCENRYKAGAWASLNILKKHWYGDFDEIRKKISNSVSGVNNGMYGKQHSIETLNKMREYSKQNNPMKVSEYVEKVRLSKVGKERPDLVGDKNPVKRDGVVDKIKASLSEFHTSNEGEDYRNRMRELTKKNHPLRNESSRKKLATSLKTRYNGLSDTDKQHIIDTFNKHVTCDICGKTTNIGNFTRWHKNKNCKVK